MNKESSLVDMVIVWGVVALESLVNYALAELQNDFELSKKSINNPNKVMKEKNIYPIPDSKLATKIVILKNEPIHKIVTLSDTLSNNRNKIIHDKPIDYEMYDDEEVITHYSSTNTYFPSYRYEDLKDFFNKCDEIKNYIIKDNILETLEIRDFTTLIKS